MTTHHAAHTPAATHHDEHPASPAGQVEHYTEQAAGYEHPELAHMQPLPVQIVESAPTARQAAPKLLTGVQAAPATGQAARVLAADPTRRRVTVSNHGGQSVVLSSSPAMAAGGVGLILAAGAVVTLETSDELHAAGLTVAGAVSWAAETAPY